MMIDRQVQTLKHVHLHTKISLNIRIILRRAENSRHDTASPAPCCYASLVCKGIRVPTPASKLNHKPNACAHRRLCKLTIVIVGSHRCNVSSASTRDIDKTALANAIWA